MREEDKVLEEHNFASTIDELFQNEESENCLSILYIMLKFPLIKCYMLVLPEIHLQWNSRS